MKFFKALTLFGLFSAVSAFTPDFNHFWTYEEIISYLSHLEHTSPHEVHKMNYGTTAEGRPLESLHFERGHHMHHRPVIFIVAGMRPREWISTMTALYFIHELFENRVQYQSLLETVEFVIVPIANPDGYVHTHSGNRMWNKNRRVNAANPACPGIDLNANFFFEFSNAVTDPCSQNYPGETYYSEIETGNFTNFMVTHKFSGRVRTYVSLQAFGEQILMPFSYSSNGGGNQAALINLAQRINNAIRTRNPMRNYQLGIAGALRPLESGTSTDNALMSVRAEYVYTIMLPAGGPTGFDPPASAIEGIGNETFPGLLELGSYFL